MSDPKCQREFAAASGCLNTTPQSSLRCVAYFGDPQNGGPCRQEYESLMVCIYSGRVIQQ